MYQTDRPLKLHSTASHGASYLYTLFDLAIWLLSRDNGLSQVDIILHPLGPTGTTTSRWLRLLNYYHRSPVGLLKAVKRQLEKIARSGRNRFVSRDGEPSVYQRIYSRGETIRIETAVGYITVRLSPHPFLGSKNERKAANRAARRLWEQCHYEGRLQPQKLLHLHYQGTPIGDLVASFALRSYPEAGGSVSHCKGIWPTLVRAVAIRNYIQQHLLNDIAQSAVHIPEPTYLHGVFQRTIHQLGGNVLESKHYTGMLNLIDSASELYNPRVITAPVGLHISEEQVQSARSYMEDRLSQPQKHLWYMFNGTNSKNGNLRNEDGDPFTVDRGTLNAVVFLHSFDDGQYWFGLDGFDDIYHWTVFTIDELIKNPDIDRVFVKPHPNVNYRDYPGDRIAYLRLKKRYAEEGRVCWLKRDVGPHAFVPRYGRFVGITHHGSVAEELTFLDVPVIAAAYAPWGAHSEFLSVWQNPEEYAELLRGLKDLHDQSCDGASSVSKSREFMEYICAYRLNARSLSVWIRFGKWFSGVVPPIDHESFRRYEAELCSLTQSSEKFKTTVDNLVAESLECRLRHDCASVE